MSEQVVTYSELKFHTPTQQQSRQRAETTKNKDSPSPLWRLFAVIFGILCLALLVTSGFLGALVSRWQQNFSQQQGILENLTCQQIILENQTRELEEILENLTWERDHLQTQNINFLQSKGFKSVKFTMKGTVWFWKMAKPNPMDAYIIIVVFVRKKVLSWNLFNQHKKKPRNDGIIL
ncbi:killer cell lectin-like receptor 7 [Trachemys scripta elegans]|uniref:killer cell lectin-like receptor 7 n=1 Tax=Trachemys scripta elegans TaxID=31138 RepID=UPI001551EEF4|nr:killer cell lectin-like receptor 7 [Trachemys scripta elegans]